ncbi:MULTISPECIES: exonuclease domain-containing protein [unclassified Corynebacterium]|uniref:exonuclease domain-containing protein n=1 Tax=unclassified Corynebacterium TaxID=2624378 RepID=UPI0029C9DADE|nr:MULTISPECIES: exonuclease domain-containing protein [unclassified Corynebacterium]WPF65398.1 exonuclease domain-containing protein [Corynebacterium sp. 22KM0430]WPF67893.1 exonuclease domain-containing protein [Corynebacterium sp. 21KM1197]
MIPAHGAQVTVTQDEVLITYSDLAAALSGTAQRAIPLDQIESVDLHSPTAYLGGWVDLRGPQPEVRVRFAPHQETQARLCEQTLSAALRGENPATEGLRVPGLDFVALDVETANADWGSICQVGAVRFIDGAEVAAQTWLCQPPVPGFHPTNVGVHGITERDVAQAPTFAECLPQIAEFLGDLPFIAHNAQFDATALHRACAAAGISAPTLHFGCTLALSRAQGRRELSVVNHRLPTVAAALGVPLDQHHDALADARACGAIAVALAARHGWAGSALGFIHSQGFTLGTVDSQRVFPVLKDRTGAGIALQQRDLGSPEKVREALEAQRAETESAGADTRKGDSKKNSGKRRANWQAVSTPEVIPEPNPNAAPDGLLFGHHVTLSGEFEPFDKGTLWQRIADQGARIGKNVTKKTTVLVTGAWTTKTSKHKRAEELQAQGQPIEIWSQEELLAALGLNEQPPF